MLKRAHVMTRTTVSPRDLRHLRHLRRGGAAARGFTVIELLVVLAALALLLSVAAPRYVQHVDRARDTALRHQGRYPTDLPELAERRYLRAIPVDPVTSRADTWVAVPPRAGNADGEGVFDVRSGAREIASDGSSYASW